MKKIHVSIIIVTYNSEKYISKCLFAILDNFSPKYECEIVIVDNHSGDKTIQIIDKIREKNQSIITTIYKKQNLGFAKAINIALKIKNNSDYYLLINPDTIVNKYSISNLYQCAVTSKSGVVGGSTYDNNNIQNGSYFRFPNLFVGMFDFTNLRKLIRSDYWHKYFYYLDSDFSKLAYFTVDVVTGGFMMISKKTIDKIGYLDERFFMYLEDVDYCLRAKKQGIKVTHCNLSKIFHYGGGSSENKDRIRHSAWIISRKLFYLKNFNLLSNILIQPIFLLDDIFILFNKYLK